MRTTTCGLRFMELSAKGSCERIFRIAGGVLSVDVLRSRRCVSADEQSQVKERTRRVHHVSLCCGTGEIIDLVDLVCKHLLGSTCASLL